MVVSELMVPQLHPRSIHPDLEVRWTLVMMMLTTINLSTSLGACVESDEDRLDISRVVGPGHCSDAFSQARETGILQERGTFPVQPSAGNAIMASMIGKDLKSRRWRLLNGASRRVDSHLKF
jgi:hypothetical protein